jgi:hypothetical protein
MRLIAIALATCTLLPTLALAEAPPADIRVETFEDELVPGDLLGPEGAGIRVHPHRRGRSLIRIRENFHPEMMGTVEDL